MAPNKKKKFQNMAASLGSRSLNVKGRRSFRKRLESEDENIFLDLNRDSVELMQEILYHVVKLDISKSSKLSYLNGLVRLCQKSDCYPNVGYSYSDIFCCIRVSFFHEASEVRAACLRACRYLLHDVEATEAFCSVKLHYLVARSLDILLDNRLERIHAIRLMRRFLCVNPVGFPSAFTNCLISVVNEGAQERELMRACLGTLAQLSILSPEAFISCNGVSSLLRNAIDCQQPKISEAILGVLLFLFNDPDMRCALKNELGLEHLLAPFTDCHYKYPSELIDGLIGEDRDSKLIATKLAIVSVLRSWPGITYFCRTEQPEIPSLVQMLYLPYPEMRKNIIDLLYEIFNFPHPEWTEDFSIAILSTDPSAAQASWQLYEGYVVAEGSSVLPYISQNRINLVENYFALLLLIFVQAGILEALVEVIAFGSIHLSVQATILLGQLLYMSNQLLPSDCCQHCNSLPSLILVASAFRTPQEQNQTSAAISALYHIHELKKQGPFPSNFILDNLLHTCNPERKRKYFFGGAVSRTKLHHFIKKDISDTINQTIKDTLIFSKDFDSWDWDLIDNILKNSVDALKKLEDTNHKNFVQRLIQFFLPSSYQFCKIDFESECAQQIIITGYHFVEFLLEMEETKSHDYLEDFLQEINNCLIEVTKENIPQNSILSPPNVLSTLSYAYFIFIGKFSCSSKGCKLLDSSGTFQNLLHLVSTTNISSYVKLVVSTLDYTKAGFSRTVLSKVLTGTTEHSRLYATNYLRVLLRAELVDFRKWAIEFLVAQLHDSSALVSSAALDILEEACNITNNLEALVSLRPSLLHLGDKGLLLLLRFLSISSGFRFLRDSNFLYYELDRWKKSYNLKYVKIVEDMLNDALSQHKKSEDGTYGRRSSDIRHSIKDAYLPHHMYGQLAQHAEGIEVLINENCLFELFPTIRCPDFSSELQILEIKAALWAMGHIGSFSLGISLLIKEDIVPYIVDLASNAPMLSVRGTCFFVLGLLSATLEGAILLKEVGWEAIQRNREEKWPLVTAEPNSVAMFIPSHNWVPGAFHENEWPRTIPYSLSLAFQSPEQIILTSHSLHSLDMEEQKCSTSNSFSSTTSVELPCNGKEDSNIRQRSSSDCQPNWKKNVFKKGEASSWDSLHSNQIIDTDKEIYLKERSVSSYEIESHSILSRSTNASDSCIVDNVFQTRVQSSEHLQTSFHVTSNCNSLGSIKYRDRYSKPPDLSRQLSRGHSCYFQTHTSDNTTFALSTIKDAQGYAALKNIQRRRVQSLCFQDQNSYLIDEDLLNIRMNALGSAVSSELTPQDSVTALKTSDPLTLNTSSHINEAADKQDSSTSSSNDNRFIGVCLPSTFDLLFSVEKKSFRTECEVTELEIDEMGLQLHSLSNCLASSSSHGKTDLLGTTIHEEIEDNSNIETEQMLNSPEEEKSSPTDQDKNSNNKGQTKLWAGTPEGKALIRKEIMRCVTNLSSSIATKLSEQGLLNLKQKFPSSFQDVCLYSEICLQMSKYNFRLSARRFLQELFLDVNFVELQWEAESVSGVTNLAQITSSDV